MTKSWKKVIGLLLLLTLMFTVIGCKKDPGEEDPEDKDPDVEEVYPSSITIDGGTYSSNCEVEIGTKFRLSATIAPSNAKNKEVNWSSNNTSAVKVDNSGNVEALSGGTATITVVSKAKVSVKASFIIVVKEKEIEPPADIKAKSLKITNATSTLEVTKSLGLSFEFSPKDTTNKGIKWSSSDTSIATVNDYGRVTGVKEGNVTITLTSLENESIKDSIELTIIAKVDEPIVEVPPTSVLIEGYNEIEVGYFVVLKTTVSPAEANQKVRWESNKPELATVDETGKVTAIAAGTVYITAYCIGDETIKSRHKISIKVDETAAIPIPDLQGYKIVIMNADSALGDIDPFHESYGAKDRSYKQQAWTDIQTEYNCTIAVEAYPDEAPWGPERIKWISAQAEVGKAQADFYTITSAWLSQLVSANSAADVLEYYQKYGKNQMEYTLRQSATHKGKLYTILKGIDESKVVVDMGLFYNYGWIEELKLESPAKLFNEGRWTYSTFVEYVEAAQALLPNDSYVLSGHVYYYYLGMMNAANTKIADTMTMSVNIKSTKSRNIATMLQRLYANGIFDKAYGWSESDGAFFERKALFCAGNLWFVRTSNRWPSTIWGEGSRFGYVPYPYPDDMDKENTKTNYSGGGASIFMPASNREWAYPNGVTLEGIYRAVTNVYLKSNQYYANDSSYDPESTKLSTAQNAIDDPESVTALMYFTPDKQLYEAAHAWYTSVSGTPLAGVLGNILKGNDFDQEMDAILESYQNGFITALG